MPPLDFEVQYPVRTALVPPADGGGWSATVDRWHQPWAEPVRTRVTWAAVTLLTASGFVGPVAPVEIIQVDKWHAAWREPVRSLPRLQTGAQQPFFYGNQNPVVSFSWFNALAEPPKPKTSVATANQQFTAFVQAAPFAEAVFESKWHQPWSEPVRVKPGLSAVAQQAFVKSFVFVTEIVTLDKWYFAWPTPPKPKISVQPASQQFIAFVKAAPFPETILESEWHQAWSEPVRLKPSLGAAYQVAQAYWNPSTPVSVVTSIGWFSPLAELPRPKQGLLAQYQWSFTAPVRLLPTPNITGSLAVTETPDRAAFGGHTFSPPFAALVGVIEDAVPPTPTSPVVSLASVSVSIREI